jgi:predicted secreted Zn-dependent protease
VQPNGLCRLATVSVGLHAGVVLPSWTPDANATPGIVAGWQSYIAALAAHEQGHVDLDVTGARRLLADLQALPALPCGSVDTRVASMLTNTTDAIERANAAYDAETNHGRGQGAILASQ